MKRLHPHAACFLMALATVACGQASPNHSHTIASLRKDLSRIELLDPTPGQVSRQAYFESWALQDPRLSGNEGTSTDHALLSLRLPPAKKEIIVAVIDTGVDIEHPDLKDKIWTDATTGIHGWNFLGNTDGANLIDSSLEVTREYKRLQLLKQARELTVEESFYLEKVKKTYEDLLWEAETILSTAKKELKRAENPKDWEEVIAASEKAISISLNADFDPSTILGDSPTDLDETSYGNSDLLGGDGVHGTHVAGIIARQSDSVRIMPIRAVPKGDERDKDIANAIEFAVHHGAKIINLSLGKRFSPHRQRVQQALKLAESREVLVVHSAGNDGKNNDEEDNFPNRFLDGKDGQKRSLSNWIEVGSSSRQLGKNLISRFSNYGRHGIDLFAPGQLIPSTVPGGVYRLGSGTSMAAPQVSGVAALLWSRFPELTVVQLRSFLLEGARKYPGLQVNLPFPNHGIGNPGKQVLFCELSVTCGILDAYSTLLLALH